jgi:hypothetical protein
MIIDFGKKYSKKELENTQCDICKNTLSYYNSYILTTVSCRNCEYSIIFNTIKQFLFFKYYTISHLSYKELKYEIRYQASYPFTDLNLDMVISNFIVFKNYTQYNHRNKIVDMDNNLKSVSEIIKKLRNLELLL